MTREVRFFGGDGRVFGIVEHGRDPGPLGFVILNAGFLDSAGPFRLGAALSEAVVERGLTACRIDQSGKGETPKRRGVTMRDSLLHDIDDVLAGLAPMGVERVILAGLCSGADDAIRIAAARDQVVGMVLLDGIARAGIRYWLRHYGPRLFKGSVWARRLTRLGRGPLGEPEGVLQLDRWDDPKQLLGDLSDCMDRGVEVQALFTGGVQHYYNHAGQLTRSLPRPPSRLEERYLGHVAHVLPIPEHRAEVVGLVGDWLERHFGTERRERSDEAASASR